MYLLSKKYSVIQLTFNDRIVIDGSEKNIYDFSL